MKERKTESFTFRVFQAKPEDAVGISALYKQVLDDYREVLPEELIDSRQPSPIQVKDRLRRYTHYVAKTGNQIIGVVGCSLVHGTCMLKHMVVDQRYQRRGVGTALTRQVIDFARKNNVTKVWLDTVPIFSEAISLYHKLGFRKSGTLRQHFWGADVELYELILTEYYHSQ
ncbi:MAG: GNAT family N-acetyltransferase [Candidatus Hermodarchaeota archaeon]